MTAIRDVIDFYQVPYVSCECRLAQQMGILFAHARDESNILCSAPFVSFERVAAGF